MCGDCTREVIMFVKALVKVFVGLIEETGLQQELCKFSHGALQSVYKNLYSLFWPKWVTLYYTSLT